MADFTVKITSFNILGLGFCALPGPDKQWTHFAELLGELLTQRSPSEKEISFVGLQEDVYILKQDETWADHTTDATHSKFERISFLRQEFENQGFEMISYSVHDGLSNSSQMMIKDPDGQLEALTDPRHRGLFTESAGAKKATKSNLIKLGNSIWVKKGKGLGANVTLRGDTVTYDTWAEGDRRGIPEYSMVPSRSAAKAVVSIDGKDVFAALTCHLAGGKFDDRWLLTGDNLTSISGQMLQRFAESETLPAVVFGDTNMKHHDMVDRGIYDDIIRGMLFGSKDPAQISKLSPAYESHRQYLLQGGDGDKVTEKEKKCLEAAGKKLEDLAAVYDIGVAGALRQEAIETLTRRAKELWRIEEVPGMTLIKPLSDQATTCLFGGVIDHIYYKGLALRSGSYAIDENPRAMLAAGTPGVASIIDRIKASDHFPIHADFDFA